MTSDPKYTVGDTIRMPHYETMPKGSPAGKLMQDELIARCRTLREERDWMAHLLATIRDKADIRYGKNRGLLAFSDLKDEAARSRPNVSDQATASAGHGIHDRLPPSGCLHPFCSPLDGPVGSK